MSGTGRRLDLRPAGVALLIAAVLLHVAWRSTGLRTLALARLGLVAVVAVNLVWAILVAERVRVRVTANTTDAVVGAPVRLQVAVEGPRQPVALLVTSWPGQVWVATQAPAVGALTPRAPARGVHTMIDVTVACHHPFGLVGWVRPRQLALAQPLAVGPQAVPGPTPARPGWAEETARPAGTGVQVRGVRDYRPGDPSRMVHWRATARTGALVVKELDGTLPPAVLVGLDLGAGGELAEQAAAAAAGSALDALGRGWTVVLATVEAGGPVTAAVTGRLEVQRRLAAACPGPAPQAPVDWRGSGVLLRPGEAVAWP